MLFEPNARSRRRMLPFVVLGGAVTLYILWALTAFPLQLYIEKNSIVYMNQATNNTIIALLYIIVTCGALFFSQIRVMVVFGAANLAILLIVMVVKRYAFTSVWCAYAAVASVIILGYFWTSHQERPFRY
jgi:K+-sensing histidine kinase KdpD